MRDLHKHKWTRYWTVPLTSEGSQPLNTWLCDKVFALQILVLRGVPMLSLEFAMNFIIGFIG